ncbi:E3 ubiquitin-protein ligase RNF135-like [Ylistrum balloti]|uniref:E3 ubiquitin-protein ligase RNF135-like n=1 Tax=Ylistrum balloti TaxID=509963 RepID=UPI002905CABD|nr:E3 ubiquitin-protein ligase RNF135-like [Ylistrum balloti]
MMEESETPQSLDRLWYKSLKCCICLDYYNNPHTLKCGHSFCISCLGRLARNAVDQHPGSNPNQIKLHCPTCRRPLSAKNIRKGKLTVNYSLQEFVENWLSEQSTIRTQTIQVRSVASQSADEGSDEEDNNEEVSRTEFREVPLRNLLPAMSSSEVDNITSHVEQRRARVTFSCGSTSDESDASFTTARDSQLVAQHAVQNLPVFSFTSILSHFLQDICGVVSDVIRCPNRSVMAVVWSGYTFSIMLISSGFFPYMLLYSVLFFLILYAESIEQRRAQRERQALAVED